MVSLREHNLALVLAVAVPGLVETRQPMLRLAPNLGWHDVPVLDELRARLTDPGAVTGDMPMRLDNEANLAALGERGCRGSAG